MDKYENDALHWLWTTKIGDGSSSTWLTIDNLLT
jgi:hypothetical protein